MSFDNYTMIYTDDLTPTAKLDVTFYGHNIFFESIDLKRFIVNSEVL